MKTPYAIKSTERPVTPESSLHDHRHLTRSPTTVLTSVPTFSGWEEEFGVFLRQRKSRRTSESGDDSDSGSSTYDMSPVRETYGDGHSKRHTVALAEKQKTGFSSIRCAENGDWSIYTENYRNRLSPGRLDTEEQQQESRTSLKKSRSNRSWLRIRHLNPPYRAQSGCTDEAGSDRKSQLMRLFSQGWS
ncbi:uncharacterized protein LOC134195180 [Corticium candelabrum]|uniref:uncharacterized protein LOC134195180 n=1 Tax=Corticium candelabrum TaxID=121492 RepID=UPI002E270161|nr:uncharacterized protein LOC134195180 [Corticium candelabrum]